MTNILLLLHGYTQNADIISNKIKKLCSKSLLSNYEIISPDGTYHIDDIKRGWWELESPEIFAKSHEYKEYNKAIDKISDCLNHLSSDDNLYIIGFSQGAVLCEMMLIHNLFKIKPKKVILISPSGIMDNRFHLTKKINLDIPILVIIGNNEGVFGITNENYEKYSFIEKYEIINHDSGHVIPSNYKMKEKIRLYIS